MSCLSDIDLATLHRTRLEERVHYKLSWWTRRLTDKQTNNYCRQSQINNLNRTTNVTTIISKIESSECIENSVMTATTTATLNGGYPCANDLSNSEKIDDLSNRLRAEQFNDHCNGNDYHHQRHRHRHRSDRSNDYHATTTDDNAINNIDIDHFPILRRRRSGTWP